MFMRLGLRPFTSFSKDHYKVLGVTANASKDEIKKAYLGLAKQHHPDTESGNEEKFKEIANAYETLNNEQERQKYDAQRTNNWAQSQYNSNQRTQGYGSGYGSQQHQYGYENPFTGTHQNEYNQKQQDFYTRKTRSRAFREQQRMYEQQMDYEEFQRKAEQKRKRQEYWQERFYDDPIFSSHDEKVKAGHAAAFVVRMVVVTSMFIGLGILSAAYSDRRRRWQQANPDPFDITHDVRLGKRYSLRQQDTTCPQREFGNRPQNRW